VNIPFGPRGQPGGNVGTFNQLPLGHLYLGSMDYVGRPNVINPSAGISVTPLPGLSRSLTQYFFGRASDRDALYNAGAELRPGTATDARHVGAELDLLVNYQFTATSSAMSATATSSRVPSSIGPGQAGTATSSMRLSSTRSERGGATHRSPPVADRARSMDHDTWREWREACSPSRSVR
jgi:hypothetical protein